MARTEQDQNMIYYKIQELNKQGFDWKQSTAIALRMYKDGELKRTTVNIKQEEKQRAKPPQPVTTGRLEQSKKKNTTSRDALISLILKQAVEAVGNNEERFIQAVATITMQSIEIIRQQYELGMENWKSFHKPGIKKEQAAREQVYKFILNG
tara:strand:- start:31 stop:486 length:456 start_codon:yes stop_codon:yes gene_type:complete